MENLVGRQFGPYRIVAPLGEGGMAAVVKAYQPNVDRYVALKVLPSYFAHDPQFLGRFRQEAKILAKLQHPNILPVYDFGEEGGYAYIVMPFVEAGSLAALLERGPLPYPQIQRIIRQLAGALDYAHSKGTVHRDVKPSNVLIDEHGNSLLTDFGIAKMVESAAAFTRTGGILGTPAYMSPEQIRGEQLDGRSDIYSLGIVLYEMLTGRPPFRAETPPAIFVKHLHDPLPPPHLYQPDISADVERVVLKGLAKDREHRFQTAEAMATALSEAFAGGQALEEQPQPAPVPDLPPPARRMASTEAMRPIRPGRPRPRWLLPGAGFLAVAIVVVLLALLARPGADQSPAAAEPSATLESRPTAIPTVPPTETPEVSSVAAPPATATPVPPTRTREPDTPLRILLAISADWARADFELSSPAGRLVRTQTIETGGDPVEYGLENSTIHITQGTEDADAGEIVYLIKEIAFVDLRADQQLQFSLEHCCIGHAILEVQNMVTGSPVTVARLVSEDDEHSGGHTLGHLDVAVADLLAASPSVVLTPLPPEPPGRGLYNAGLGYIGTGEYAEAIAAFDEAAAMGWERSKLYAGRAWACRQWYDMSRGCDLEQAIADWSRAIELDPDNPRYHADRATAYAHSGQQERAVAGFIKALELDPENAAAWNEKGASLHYLGDPQAALADHNRAIDLDPTVFSFYVDRAHALAALGEIDLAIADLTQASEMQPDVYYIYLDRAWLYAGTGDDDAAREDFQRFLELSEGETDWDDSRAQVQEWLNSH